MRGDVGQLAEHLLHLLSIRQLTLITAESCTAGALSQRLADAPGAGLRFHGGFVAYTKAQKNCALGVPAELLRQQGAVSGEVARAMAEGALRHSTPILRRPSPAWRAPNRTKTAIRSGGCVSRSRAAPARPRTLKGAIRRMDATRRKELLRLQPRFLRSPAGRRRASPR